MSNTKEQKAPPSPPTPELLKECRDKVEVAMGNAIKNLFDDERNGGDWYAHILMQMDRIIDDPRIPTAAVSITDKINLYVNSYFFVHTLGEGLDLKKEEDKRKLASKRAAVIKHEILHCIFHHMSRGKDFGNPMLANIAADLVVNSCIDKNILGEQFLYPEKYKLPKDQTLDWYYSNFPIQQQNICQDPSGHDKKQQQQGQGQQSQGQGQQQGQQQGQGQGQPGQGQSGQGEGTGEGAPSDNHEHGENGTPCGHDHSKQGQGQGQQGQGQGQDQQSAPGHAIDENGNCKECGGVRTFDNHNVWTDDEGDHVSDAMKESLVKDAINRATDSTKNAGNLPRSVQDMIVIAKTKPQVPWQMILKQFVSKLSNGELSHTKKRLSKRFGTRPGIKIKPKLKLAIAMDVSGSITEKEYEVFLNEIFAITRHIGEVEVIEWDTQVQGNYKIKGYKPKITRTGQGGTDPTDAIKWVNNRKNSFDGVIFFSDGYFAINEITNPIRVPALFVITSNGDTSACKKYRTIKLPKAS